MIEANLPVLIPISLLLTALLVPVLGIWKRSLAFPVSMAGVLFSFIVSVLGLQSVLTSGPIHYRLGGWMPPIGIEYVLDPLSAFMAVLITGVSSLVLIHSRASVESEIPERLVPYYGVNMLLLTGLTGIVVTGDLFNLYVFLEIASLAAYAIVAVGEKRAPVAAFRYLLLGTIGATFYLFGLGFIYIVTGSLNMADVAKILPHLGGQPAIIVGFVLMITGIGMKMALFPMHGWLPDAYTYAPSAGSALIAPIGTKVAAYSLIRVILFVFEPEYARTQLPILEIIAWFAAAGIIYGSVMAIAQKELKRMLAYSSVAQIGYIGLGIGMATPLGFIGAVLHILNHAFMKAALFLVAGNLRKKIGHSNIPEFDDTLRRRMPWTMAAFSTAALSMIGIPPLAGFFSKWYLVLAGFETSSWFFVAVILLSSLLNAVYFFRVLEKVYLRSDPNLSHAVNDQKNNRNDPNWNGTSDDVEPSMLIPTLALAAGLIVLGLLNVVVVDGIIRLMIPPGL